MREWLFHIFEPVDKILICAVVIQMKATEHFPDDVRFIILYKMVLTFDTKITLFIDSKK